MEIDQQQQQDDYDAKFEFDAPRYYDFDSMAGGTPGDKWFDTAPDGPGCKADKGVAIVSREPLKSLQEQQRLEGNSDSGTLDAPALQADDENKGLHQQQRQQQQKGNIVTCWKQPSVVVAPAAALAPKFTENGRKDEAAAAAAGPSRPAGERKSTGQHLTGKVRRISAADNTKTCSQRTSFDLHHVLQPKITKPVRSTKALTLPDDFELVTSKRIAGQAAASDQLGKSPFRSLAEKVRDFQSKTPARFKSKPEKPAASKQRSPITKPEAPLLMTGMRSRPARFRSQQELEAEEAERARQEQFHAKPVDTRVLSSSGQLGVPKVDKPRLTEPQPFKLRSDSRAQARKSHELPTLEQAAAAATFKAQPVKKSILDGPTFKPRVDRHELTVPKSPLLRTKLRSHTPKSEEPSTQAKPRPLSASSNSSDGVAPKATVPHPFRLQTEARGQLHREELVAKLAAEEARAKRLRRVTARPLPVSVDVPMAPPKPEPKPLTLPDPFPLKSLARHSEFEKHHKQLQLEEEEAALRAAEFKARPLLTTGPFVVHESDAPLTVPLDPHLHTDVRAVERQAFDVKVAEKMQHEEEEKQQQEDLKRQRDEAAVKDYRKKLRFSARPMPNFDQPYLAMPSEKPLTNPKTPNFASKKLKRSAA
eukprot:gene2311-2619_t